MSDIVFQGSQSRMPTRNISLTAEQDAFVQQVVEAGEYQNASEAVRDALRALQQRRREDSLKLKRLKAEVNAGLVALNRGEFAEFDDAALDELVAKACDHRCRRTTERRARKRIERNQVDLARHRRHQAHEFARMRNAVIDAVEHDVFEGDEIARRFLDVAQAGRHQLSERIFPVDRHQLVAQGVVWRMQ